MKKNLFLIFFLIATLFAGSDQQFAKIGDLTLESGKIIKDCSIGYRTTGTINKDSSNIILYPTWFGGASEHIIGLVEKYNVADPSKYFIIALDALGNGISTSPSNYDGETPIFSIKDMVNAEYLAITKILKIKKIYAIVGGSMGSFQTFQWLVSYPDFMEKAIPYVCSPKRTSSDKMWLNLEKDIITLQNNYNVPEGETQRIMNILTAYIARTQNYMSRNIATEDFEEHYQSYNAMVSEPFNVDNRLSQINAMLQHDITKDFDDSLEKAANYIKAKMLIIVSDSDQIVNPQPALELAKITDSKLVILSNECGHLAPGCDLEAFANYINDFLNEK